MFFIYLTFRVTTENERTLIWNYIKSAKIEYVFAAMTLGACSDIIRGLRWQFLSNAIGYKSNTIISVASVFMCYTSNMAIPRSGEIVRASILSEYNKIPIGKTFGTIAAERIVDITISLFILILVWLLQYDVILESLFDDNFLYNINQNIGAILIVSILMFCLIIFTISKIKK